MKHLNEMTQAEFASSAFFLLIAVFLWAASSATGEVVLYDDFNDDSINAALWTAVTQGSGTVVEETNQNLQVTFQADSAGAIFSGEYRSNCILMGDFDLQVDYELLVWPNNNGVRVGLYAEGIGAVERTSFSTHDSRTPGEYYVTDFVGQRVVQTATSDMSGKIRMTRQGDVVAGYYYSAEGDWVEIVRHTVTTGDIGVKGLRVAAWSHDYAFDDQEVKVAFDNFVVNQGQLLCPITLPMTGLDDTMPPTGAVHAHDNMLLPNNRTVEVVLDGYVIDEMSMARDGEGIGISSAYLLVDGAEIVLRDETTDLLSEDGGFNVIIEVKAVKDAVYNIELYATDTEPQDLGGPNSGLVDSTYIRVPHDMSRGRSDK